MSTASSSSSTTVVGPRFSPSELVELDRQSARLGVSRAGVVKLVWARFGDEVVESEAVARASGAANAGAVAQASQPLVDALGQARDAWHRRAHQRRMIGVSVNQIAKLANTLSLMIRDGKAVTASDVEDLAAAAQAIERRLGQQSRVESDDDRVLAGVHALLDLHRVKR